MADETIEKNNIETTNHQWDDEDGYPLREYNNPLPKWWLYSYYVTIIYAVIYWILYPAWPTFSGDYTKGVLGWSQHKQLEAELTESAAAKKPFDDRIAALPAAEIISDPQLLQYAVSGGKALFGDNCAPCHGSGGVGAKAGGFPALTDDDWLYGGTIEQILESVSYGRAGQMPAHLEAADGSFSAVQVEDLTQYTLSLTNRATDASAAKRGDELFHGDAGCNSCHGDAANGSLMGSAFDEKLDVSIGAPNLGDMIWLYGGKPEEVRNSIAYGRAGQMPAWSADSDGANRKLDALAVKQVSIYVHTLGGGQ